MSRHFATCHDMSQRHDILYPLSSCRDIRQVTLSLAVVESICYRVLDEHMNFMDGVLDCWVWTATGDSSFDQLKIIFESET
eukprot:scaffold19184_cov46-Cyclotella_meneghiniana.AAC.9